MPDLGSEETLRKLASGDLVWPIPPWNDQRNAETTYRWLCADVSRRMKLQSRIEWDDYGSGYASYIDAWFYKDEPAFKATRPTDSYHGYVGLWVLLSRVTPFFVMGEGVKTWDEDGRASSYLPDWQGVDRIESEAVMELSTKIDDYLTSQGFMRLRQDEVSQSAPADIEIATILNPHALRLFDVLFNWMD